MMLVLSFTAKAQQDMVLTNYTETMFIFNPAFTGAEQYTHFAAVNRMQHLNMTNAPTSNVFACNSAIENIDLTAGGYLFNDKIGIYNHSGINLSTAYKIPLENSNLAFGLGMTAENYRIDRNRVDLINENDPLILQGTRGDWGYNGSFGAAWFSEKTRIGFSATNLIPAKLDFGAGNVFSYARHYYLLFSQTFLAGEASNVTLASIMSYTSQKPFQYEAHASWNFYRFTLGAGYRGGDAALVFFGINLFNEFYLNYSHDLTISPLKSGTLGTSEIMLVYKFYYNPSFKKVKPKYKWIKKAPKPAKE